MNEASYWQMVDWQDEIEACFDAAISTSDEEESKAFRMTVGRCILLMQEHLPKKEWKNILWAVNKPVLLENCFKKYIEYISRMVEANS
jgi:hypothetical protein